MTKEIFDNARWAISAISRALRAKQGEGLAEVLQRLDCQVIDESAFMAPQPARLPVLHHLPHCIGEAMLLDPELAAAIASLEDELEWRQTEQYPEAVMGEGFMANYGWSQIIGPHGCFPGDDFLLGLMLLGPGQHYRDHYHPAPELYWPLTGPSDWKQGAGSYETKDAGSVIWHIPWKVHATATYGIPLLAVWCWTRDTDTPAKLVGT
ncbi:MAG: hypothetical protein KDK89_09125 [Alphaproteobacteria bacterium]|nr:hypothetical protein [Alphaproteobacteria bacterium]